MVPFAPIPGGTEPGGGSEEDGLNQADRRIAEPFRRVLGSVLTASRLGSDNVALVGLQCAQLILALFPRERGRLAQPEIAAVLEEVLARGQPAQKELAILNAAAPQKKTAQVDCALIFGWCFLILHPTRVVGGKVNSVAGVRAAK